MEHPEINSQSSPSEPDPTPVEFNEPAAPLQFISPADEREEGAGRGAWLLFLGLALVLAVLLGVVFFPQLSAAVPFLSAGRGLLPPATAAATPTPAPTAPPTATATATPVGVVVPTPAPVDLAKTAFEFVIPTLTPPPGGTIFVLTPESNRIGWASTLDQTSHFNDPNIHVGSFNGNLYYGAIQFNLSQLPPHAPITYASLELVGLSGQNLGTDGAWTVQMLAAPVDNIWSGISFEQLQLAAVDTKLLPSLPAASLAQNRINTFSFGPAQLEKLQQHLREKQNLTSQVISFRLDGPVTADGQNNLFTWDSGLNGTKALKEQIDRDKRYPEQFTPEELIRLTRKPVLWVVVGASEYVVITATPTPDNIFTAAAVAATETVIASTQTPTPFPPEWVTPLVVTVAPPPGNAATATQLARIVTAEAVAYGTATATPLNVWTATPTPQYEYVTSTPTPENVMTKAAIAAEKTRITENFGTPTRLPDNWATPFVVTPQPSPRSEATRQYYAEIATAEAFLYGMVWTATPTAIYATPTPAQTFTPTPGFLPVSPELVGKIAFLSDRGGDINDTKFKPQVYIMDADGSNVTLLSDRGLYDSARARDAFSADQRFRAFVTQYLRFDGRRLPGIYYYDSLYDFTDQLTKFGKGIAYDPAWSPTREQVAFVSNDSNDDEIWVINRDGTNLMQLTESNSDWNGREIGKDTFIPEMSKRPSWSPDGNQIVYWSNRTDGRSQIWVMDADGNNQYIINPGPYNDWNPVWIKYTDSPPPVPEPTKARRLPYIDFN